MPESRRAPSLRIGIDGRELRADVRTGIARYLANFIEATAAGSPQHALFVYGNQHTVLRTSAPNIRLRRRPQWLTVWYDQVTLPRMAREDAVDVFLSPFDKAPLWTGCPTAVTVHDLTFLVHSDRRALGRLAYNAAYRLLRAPLIRKADVVITDSEFSGRDIERRLHVDRSRIHAIPIGVPPGFRPVTDAEALQAFQRKADIRAPYILYVGNFKPHKNVACLVRAYASLPDRLRAGHQLVLCGPPDAHSKGIADETRRLNVDDRVVFTGFVADADMPALYSGAALFVLPSLCEGFGLGNLESMACGTPVVSSRAASMPEVVGDAGLLVDARRPDRLAEAIAAVLDDPELRRDLAGRALRRAAGFTAERTSGRIIALLEDLAGAPRAARPHEPVTARW